MRPAVHVSVSLGIGLALGLIWGAWQTAFWSAVGGILIDLDHVVEYVWTRGQWRSLKDFYDFWGDFHESKIYLILHVGEAVLFLAAAALLGLAPALTGGLAIGIIHHLLLDQWGNHARWPCYFLTGRLMHQFESRQLFYHVNANTMGESPWMSD